MLVQCTTLGGQRGPVTSLPSPPSGSGSRGLSVNKRREASLVEHGHGVVLHIILPSSPSARWSEKCRSKSLSRGLHTHRLGADSGLVLLPGRLQFLVVYCPDNLIARGQVSLVSPHRRMLVFLSSESLLWVAKAALISERCGQVQPRGKNCTSVSLVLSRTLS